MLFRSLLDGLFTKRTLLDPQMQGAEELLFERIPADTPIARAKTSSFRRPNRISFLSISRSVSHSPAIGENALSYNGSFSILASDEKGIELIFDGIALTPPLKGNAPFPMINLSGKPLPV